MKSTIFIIGILICNLTFGQTEKNKFDTFDYYLYDFYQDTTVRFSSIEFPLKIITFEPNGVIKDSILLNKQDWNDTIVPYISGLHAYDYGGGVSQEDYLRSKKMINSQSKVKVYTLISKRKIEKFLWIKNGDKWILNEKRIYIADEHCINQEITNDFELFYMKFIDNQEFCNSRIVYPFKHKELFEKDTTYFFNSSEWKYNLDPEMYHRLNIIYDNIESKFENSRAKFIVNDYHDSGAMYGYNYRKIKGKWYLVSSWDCSN